MSERLGPPRRLSVVVLAVLGVFLLAGVVLAATYSWTGGGDGTSWDDEDNWSVTGVCQPPNCYPHLSTDDASINALNCSPCTIDLVADEIDDISMPSGEVTFDGNSSATVLTVDTLTAGNTVADTKITFTGGARIANTTE